MRIRTMYNRTKKDSTFAKIEGISQTVPNQSYTIEELFDLYKNNIKLPIEEYIPQFDELDLEQFNPDIQQGEDIIDWYNRLSDYDKQAVIDTLESNQNILSDQKKADDITRDDKEDKPSETK